MNIQAWKAEQDAKIEAIRASQSPVAAKIQPAALCELTSFIKLAQTVNGFDYRNQAWVVDGRYKRCGHSVLMPGCVCYGRLHEGELIGPDDVPNILM